MEIPAGSCLRWILFCVTINARYMNIKSLVGYSASAISMQLKGFPFSLPLFDVFEILTCVLHGIYGWPNDGGIKIFPLVLPMNKVIHLLKKLSHPILIWMPFWEKKNQFLCLMLHPFCLRFSMLELRYDVDIHLKCLVWCGYPLAIFVKGWCSSQRH